MKLSRRTLMRTALYGGLATAAAGGYAVSQRLEICRQQVEVAGLPSSLRGLTLGVMSDFHAGAWGTEEINYQAFAAMQAAQPDIIVLLGDYIDGALSHSPHNIAKGRYLFELISKLKAPLGLFAVLGNHDHWTDARAISNLLTGAGCTLLNNQHQQLTAGLILAGVDDFWEGPARPEHALQGLDPTLPVLLLSHNPDVNMLLTPDLVQVKLVLAGHTHGGQVRLPISNKAPWVPSSAPYRGQTGLIRETSQRSTYISKGIGTFFVPVRFNCPADIALLQLV